MRNNIFIILFFLPFITFSQTWENVKNNPQYIYGEGWGVTLDEADKQALNDLISKIRINVVSMTNASEKENISDMGIDATTNFNSLISTYSQATLNNTEKIILENEPNAHIGRWIKRSEINKIFESRKNKIKDYVASALKAEKAGKIDIALKDFYWAFALLNSLQYPNDLTYIPDEDESVVLMNWIPSQMNEILENIKISSFKKDGNVIELGLLYKDSPVNSVDYSFFDGLDWSYIYSAKDGVGIIELPEGNNGQNIRIKIEFEYKGQSHIDKEVESVILASNSIPMPKAYQNVNLTENQNLAIKSNNSPSNNLSRKPIECTPNPEINKALNQVIEAITNKKYDDISNLFTPEGYEIYQRLLKYGKAKIVGVPSIKFYESNGSVIARGLQLAFSFSSGMRKSFVEDVAFTFNEDNKIDNISFGLGKKAVEDILGKRFWNENARFAIINFLEDYQTAYALKRLDYIETIFDDDAVIITGKVVHRDNSIINGEINGIQFGGDIIKYNRHTKDSYLRELKRSFAGKEYINLRFADNEIRKLGKGGEVYAIQISQEYYSSNYGDKGYLFLMIDFNDPSNPVIKVRTWQPEKDPDFGIYGPEHFF